MVISTALFIGLTVATTAVTTFNCRNADLEVTCNEARCIASAEGDFTPMSLAFNDAGSFSLCAYSGCWEGEGRVFSDSRYLHIMARNLAFTPDVNPEPNRQDLAIVLDKTDNIALLKLGHYAQPMPCLPLI